MFRRLVCLVLIPCVLLNQAAALGHVHADGQSADHDLRPHVHTNLTPAHHHPAGCRHLHAPGDEPVRHLAAPDDHDADAVFVDAGEVTAPGRVSADGDPGSRAALTICYHDPLTNAPARPPLDAWRHGLPPPRPCPIYVRHLALLI